MTNRTSYVIAPDGKIAFVHSNLDYRDHVTQTLAAVKALKEIAPELRFQLGKAVRMRHVPELHFHYDDSVDRGERIDNLLRDLPVHGDDPGTGGGGDGTP